MSLDKTKKELKKLAALLEKIENPREGLPQPVFDALLKIIPFVACELVIIDREKGLLLTWREDEWFKGWHFPGGILRYRESFEERIQKTAQNELDVKIASYKFLFPINYNKSRRGHGVSLVFLCRVKTTPGEGKFFKTMPKDIIEEHRKVWRKVSKYRE